MANPTASGGGGSELAIQERLADWLKPGGTCVSGAPFQASTVFATLELDLRWTSAYLAKFLLSGCRGTNATVFYLMPTVAECYLVQRFLAKQCALPATRDVASGPIRVITFGQTSLKEFDKATSKLIDAGKRIFVFAKVDPNYPIGFACWTTKSLLWAEENFDPDSLRILHVRRDDLLSDINPFDEAIQKLCPRAIGSVTDLGTIAGSPDPFQTDRDAITSLEELSEHIRQCASQALDSIVYCDDDEKKVIIHLLRDAAGVACVSVETDFQDVYKACDPTPGQPTLVIFTTGARELPVPACRLGLVVNMCRRTCIRYDRHSLQYLSVSEPLSLSELRLSFPAQYTGHLKLSRRTERRDKAQWDIEHRDALPLVLAAWSNNHRIPEGYVKAIRPFMLTDRIPLAANELTRRLVLMGCVMDVTVPGFPSNYKPTSIGNTALDYIHRFELPLDLAVMLSMAPQNVSPDDEVIRSVLVLFVSLLHCPLPIVTGFDVDRLLSHPQSGDNSIGQFLDTWSGESLMRHDLPPTGKLWIDVALLRWYTLSDSLRSSAESETSFSLGHGVSMNTKAVSQVLSKAQSMAKYLGSQVRLGLLQDITDYQLTNIYQCLLRANCDRVLAITAADAMADLLSGEDRLDSLLDLDKSLVARQLAQQPGVLFAVAGHVHNRCVRDSEQETTVYQDLTFIPIKEIKRLQVELSGDKRGVQLTQVLRSIHPHSAFK